MNNETSSAPVRPTIRHSVQVVATSSTRWKKISLVLVSMIAAIAFTVFLGKWFGAELPRFELWIQSLGWWGPAVFVVAFSILTLLQLPEFLLAIAGGVAFGLWEGTLVVSAANVVAALFAFFIYRRIFRNRFDHLLERHPKMKAVQSAVSSKGFKLMALMRLAPFNFSILTPSVVQATCGWRRTCCRWWPSSPAISRRFISARWPGTSLRKVPVSTSSAWSTRSACLPASW